MKAAASSGVVIRAMVSGLTLGFIDFPPVFYTFARGVDGLHCPGFEAEAMQQNLAWRAENIFTGYILSQNFDFCKMGKKIFWIFFVFLEATHILLKTILFLLTFLMFCVIIL
jgi:hypothetical protein